MIPSPFNSDCRVIYIVIGRCASILVYGPSGMARKQLTRMQAAKMLVNIQNRIRSGKGSIHPGIDGWTYYP